MKRSKKKKSSPARLPGQMELFGQPAKKLSSKPHGRNGSAKASQRPQKPSISFPTSGPAPLLDVRQAAVRLGLSKSTLDKMRSRGVGPRFIKSTDRAVRYDPRDLDTWVDERRRQSTDGA